MKPIEAELERVRLRLSALIREAAELLGSRYRSELSHQEFVEGACFRGWRAGCLALLQEALGTDSPYFREFESCCDSPYVNAVARGKAILAAVRDYVDSGPVSRVEELVAADVFVDLLTIARRMIDSGAIVQAVMIEQAVLEAVMRRLMRSRHIGFHEDRDDLAALNRKLADSVYGAPLATRIGQWIAASAQPARMTSKEAASMLAFVREFVADYLV
jgi:hypothetical protein